ncbi:hypothetical protein [Wukongibacter sp. M2B1]|uniref:hypothetical protein n=1 Tax=Wukongibacter sp. M2B1 TaxID=3088895 RepID=UPI003D7980C7
MYTNFKEKYFLKFNYFVFKQITISLILLSLCTILFCGCSDKYKSLSEKYQNNIKKLKEYESIIDNLNAEIEKLHLELEHKNKEMKDEVSNKDMELKSIIIGVWQDDSCVGTAYSDKYHFYKNNKFKFFYSQYDEEKRIENISGQWKIKNTNLHLIINEKTMLIGGDFVESPVSTSEYQLINATREKIEIDPPHEIIYPLGQIKDDSDAPINIAIGGKRFWRLSEEPVDYLD